MDWQSIYSAVEEAHRSGRATTTLKKDEIIARASAFYNEQLKTRLEPSAAGKFIAIDAETFDYTVADDDVHASLVLLAKDPTCGPRLFGLRIGFATAYRIGRQGCAR